MRTHPETGRKALYVNAAHTALRRHDRGGERAAAASSCGSTRSVPNSPAASAGSAGSLAFWDNRCAQHNRDQRLPRLSARDAPHHPGRRQAALARSAAEIFGKSTAGTENGRPAGIAVRRRFAVLHPGHRMPASSPRHRRTSFAAEGMKGQPCQGGEANEIDARAHDRSRPGRIAFDDSPRCRLGEIGVCQFPDRADFFARLAQGQRLMVFPQSPEARRRVPRRGRCSAGPTSPAAGHRRAEARRRRRPGSG